MDGVAYEKLYFSADTGCGPNSGFFMGCPGIHFNVYAFIQVDSGQFFKLRYEFLYFVRGILWICFYKFFSLAGIVINPSAGNSLNERKEVVDVMPNVTSYGGVVANGLFP